MNDKENNSFLIIVCESCKKTFDLENIIPMGLPCGHTLCFNCLEERYKIFNYVKCTNCNRKHFDELKTYPKNESMINYMKLSEDNTTNLISKSTCVYKKIKAINFYYDSNNKNSKNSKSQSIIFSYYDVIINIIETFDRVKLLKESQYKLLNIIKQLIKKFLKFIVTIAIISLHYFLYQTNLLLTFFTFSVINHEAENRINVYRWSLFITQILLENFLYCFYILSFCNNLWIISKIIFLFFLLGSENEVNIIFKALKYILRKVKIIYY